MWPRLAGPSPLLHCACNGSDSNFDVVTDSNLLIVLVSSALAVADAAPLPSTGSMTTPPSASRSLPGEAEDNDGPVRWDGPCAPPPPRYSARRSPKHAPWNKRRCACHCAPAALSRCAPARLTLFPPALQARHPARRVPAHRLSPLPKPRAHRAVAAAAGAREARGCWPAFGPSRLLQQLEDGGEFERAAGHSARPRLRARRE